MFIVGNIFGCIFWGVLIALVVTAIISLLCIRFIRNVSYVTYAVLFALLIFLGIQSTLSVGALYSKNYVTDMGDYANTFVLGSEQSTNYINDLDNLFSQLGDEFPIMEPILGTINKEKAKEYISEGHTIVDYIVDEVHNTINAYLYRRLLWMLCGVILAIIAIVLFNKRFSDYSTRSRPTRSMVVQRRPSVNIRRR